MSKKVIGYMGALATAALYDQMKKPTVKVIEETPEQPKSEEQLRNEAIVHKRMTRLSAMRVKPNGFKKFEYLVGNTEHVHLVITIYASNEKNAIKKFNRMTKELEALLKNKKGDEQVDAEEIFNIECKYNYLIITFKNPVISKDEQNA